MTDNKELLTKWENWLGTAYNEETETCSPQTSNVVVHRVAPRFKHIQPRVSRFKLINKIFYKKVITTVCKDCYISSIQ